jgi:hypothetical protein
MHTDIMPRRKALHLSGRPSALGWFAALAICLPVQAWAERGAAGDQDLGGVEDTGIQQGSGAITTRSEVTIAVESLPGTPALRLQAIGDAIGTKMAAIRLCYIDVARERPTVEGRLKVRVEVRGGRATLTPDEDTARDPALTKCVMGQLRSASYTNVSGESGGMVVMEFTNTAAEGAAAVERERRGTRDRVVRMVDGRPQANSQTAGGEIEVTITGGEEVSPEAVALLYRSVQARVGSLLDCRRRASRGGVSPAGQITLSLRIPTRGAASAQRQESTVAFSQAPQCVIQMLRESARGLSEASGAYQVVVRFAE